MAEKRYYWLKLEEGFFRQKEIKKLRKLAGGDTYTIIYLKLLLHSLAHNGFLYYEGIEASFAEELALDIDENEDDVSVTLSYLQSRGILEEKSPDEMLLITCAEMTGSETASAKRVRRLRNKENLLENSAERYNVTQNRDIVQKCNSDVTKCNTEIEREKREELNKENREEIQSTKRTVFSPPTLEEVTAYCQKRQNNVNANAFINYYTSNGWMVGRNKMKDWKAAIRTWEAKDKKGTVNEYENLARGAGVWI